MTDTSQAVSAARFQRAPISGPITTNVLPKAVDPTELTVVAVLAGPSVADLQEAGLRKLTRAEKNAVKAQRVSEQAGPRASIEAAGGKVIGSFQSALNGLKVRVTRKQIAALRRIPGVVDVRPVATYTHENFVGVQRIQAPFAWAGVTGVHGEGVKVAILDTGIDYTHANFGGPGTPEAFNAAFAASTAPADPAVVGPGAPKVKGGTDIVGDDYDASGVGDQLIPVPDANPLDCNGHGSHVAGTAGGFGVLADGTTYRGPYDQVTHATHAFSIGPGVAPLADLYAVRVFGCNGSTSVIAEALEWAVDNDMDVVNMSLGAAFGTPDSADALAADNAVRAGVNVVSAAGNDGDARYILSSPGSSTRSIAAAATATPGFIRMANLALPAVAGDGARTIGAVNANNAALSSAALNALVLKTGTSVSLGCDPAEFVAQGAAGKIVIVQRGICARVAKAINGQKAGALAVVMINNAAGLPPFEGQITQNPDNGEHFVVTIPFLGVGGTVSTPGAPGFFLAQRDGASISVTEGTPIKTGTAGFTSGGPRTGDSALKPDAAAPGELVVSTLIGSGTDGFAASGTSMATPHIAGAVALAVQAHPKWKPAAIKSAIINSGNPDELADYSTHRVGSGVINAASAVGTLAYAFANRDETTLNFGLAQFKTDYSNHRAVHVRNDALTAVTFDVGVIRQQGSPHTVTTSASQITVPARSEASIDVAISVPAATAGDSNDFRDVAGLITFTPTTSAANRGISLRVPYYLVPRVSSNINTTLPRLRGPTLSANASVSNNGTAVVGTADFYAWGLESPNVSLGRIDLRGAGVQSLDVGIGDPIVVFALNTFGGWSAPQTQEFDVLVDVNADGVPDFDIFSIDFGLLTVGSFTGQIVAAIFDLNTGFLFADFFAFQPTDSSTVLLPVFASTLGVTPTNPRFTYSGIAFDLLSADLDDFGTSAGFNAFESAVTTGQFVGVAPETTALVPVQVDSIEFARTPALGIMVVTPDNKNGATEADLVRFRF